MRRMQEVVKDKKALLEMLKVDGMLLEDFSEFADDEESVFAAVSQTGKALRYASARLLNNRAIAKKAVSNYGDALGYLDIKMRSDLEIVLAAVKQDGMAIRFASDELRSNLQIVWSAVNQREIAFGYCGIEIRKEVEDYSRSIKGSKTLKECLLYMVERKEAEEEKERLGKNIVGIVGGRIVKAL